jgi:hypothetical protein
MMANLILYPFGFEDISRLNDSDILEIFRLPTGYETIIKKIYFLPQNRNIQLTDASIEILTRNSDPKNPITITTYPLNGYRCFNIGRLKDKTTLFSPGGKFYKITNNEKTVKINVLTDKIMQDIFGSVSNIKFIT